MSVFGSIPAVPPNNILGVALECKMDTFPNKIDLTIGAYRGENGKPYVLKTVRKAENIMIQGNLDHEYLSQDGHPVFLKETQNLLFGSNHPILKQNRIYSIQGISGTGSLRLATEFLGHLMPNKQCAIPSVTWPNHQQILKASRVNYMTYRYLDSTGCQLDFNGLIEDINQCANGSIVMLHSCAHNPSGVDPSEEQWKAILEIVKTKKLLPFFDNAYQGFVSGDPDKDAFSIRLFAEAGLEMIVACSFAKNFGLYGERAGVLHFITSSPDMVQIVGSQLRAISRTLWSTCPAYGARIVATILADPVLNAEWKAECKMMADRLNGVRQQLFEELVKHNVKGKWNHIIAQKGMFSYTGITADTVAKLKRDYHVYMLSDGRISLAGLNKSNIERFASALLTIIGPNK